jgi:hypothetical protein
MPESAYPLVFSSIPKPLLQLADGTLISNPRFLRKVHDGYGFSISNRFESVGVGNSAYMYMQNPSGSGRDVFVVATECSGFAQGWIDVYRGVTVTTPGTSITPVNLNFSSNIASVVNAEHSGTYDTTGADLVHATVATGGTGVHATGGLAEVGEVVVIPPGNNFLVIYTNKSGSTQDMSIRILWWEEV